MLVLLSALLLFGGCDQPIAVASPQPATCCGVSATPNASKQPLEAAKGCCEGPVCNVLVRWADMDPWRSPVYQAYLEQTAKAVRELKAKVSANPNRITDPAVMKDLPVGGDE